MLIVACQVCGEMRILPGTPDADGVARTVWTCPCCGAGQVLQLPVSTDASGGELRRIVAGMGFSPDAPLEEEKNGP
ncbi:MAG: hypothetical protein BWY01_01385 [Synergistetes bacterium ADurb.Bin155]|jgi:hypothetical protein|nr:alcohol dehydrogenase [Synergistales bacterium]NMD18381.1 alcohol dehydrogenase [Synergistaceae bacterium]OQB45218.1 MAG: hypothetical protein BWY01_01385 [Synergistetes bacterium ADurb.Bin155]MBP8995660.1 alcohol dehydrogenase [Synergistales bacterium]HOC82611.1 alcohol dehydrogenase [Synergistales bacterium]